MKHDFHKASELAAQFPGQISAPSKEMLNILTVGMCVKVGVGEFGKGSEAFWVELTDVRANSLSGIIVNELIHTNTHGLTAGDEVTFEPACVFGITD